jgi:hydrogenase maturation protease
MSGKRILVAGIGNIFFGDDGFGVEVSRRLSERALPEGVRVVDFGIRGFDLTFALLEGYDAVVLVDVVKRGGQPGTLYVVEPELGPDPEAGDIYVETHGMDPGKVLALARAMGGNLERLRLVACEPLTFGEDGMGIGLSEPVQAAVEPAVELVQSVVAGLREECARA